MKLDDLRPKMRSRYMTDEEFDELYMQHVGFCTSCGHETCFVDPAEREVFCEYCADYTACGVEVLVEMSLIHRMPEPRSAP